jgi:hypothetical protein
MEDIPEIIVSGAPVMHVVCYSLVLFATMSHNANVAVFIDDKVV